MIKFQLFTRKDGQQPVGNKFAIYDTLEEAQYELRWWLKYGYGSHDNYSYFNDGLVAEWRKEGFEITGYDLPGWYKATGNGGYEAIYYDFQINDADFMKFRYDVYEYYIEEVEVEDE